MTEIKNKKNSILLLAIGNEFLADDGAGPKTGRLIWPNFDSKIDYKEVCESGLGLIDFLTGYNKVLIIDAIEQDLEPGSVVVLDANNIKPIRAPSPHSVGVPLALKVGRRLGIPMPEEIKIIGIQVKDATLLSENLTKEVETALPKAVEEGLAILKNWLKEK